MVDAMAQGHRAAEAIDAYLRGGQAGARPARAADAVRRRPRNPRPDAPRQDRVKMPQADPAGRVARLHRNRPGLQRGAGHRRGQALPGLRPVQRVHAVRQGLLGRRDVPRPAARGDEIDVGSVILTPGFEEFQASLRGRVRPRALRQRAFQRAVRAHALGRGSHRRPRPAALGRRRGEAASPSSSASAAATPPAATATARPSAA